MLCILDGWGLSDNPEYNAVTLGDTPNFDRLWRDDPHTQLKAHGENVGLQPGVFGNSEVGHLNIGAGRVVWQDSLLIDRAIDDGSFFENETLRAAMQHALQNNTRLHLIGLISNGSVHSSETHYFALLEMAARLGLCGDRVLVHAFTDGRDTPPRSAKTYLSRLLAQMVKTGSGAVASVIGRYYAMDRDNRWERVQEAYDCLTRGTGRRAASTREAIEAAYSCDENDEFIHATVVCDESGNPRPRIAENDAVIFFNYRSDRGRQLAQCFTDETFDAQLREPSQQPGAAEAENTPTITTFRREVFPRTHFVTMTRYAATLKCPICFEPRPQRNGLGETVAKAGKTQLRIAETEKYPHVTYFFSGGMETPWDGEERVLVPSPKVATYDLQPQMSAPEVTAAVTNAIRSGQFDFIALNFANPDMVGHTGILEAAIAAVEEIDRDLGEVVKAIDEVGGALLVIADHGNCDQMIDYVTREPHTAHTTNPVPCILHGDDCHNYHLRSGGKLADVAPTLLDLMRIEKPAAMTGESLLRGTDSHDAAAQEESGETLSQARARVLAAQLFASTFYNRAAPILEARESGAASRTLALLRDEMQDQLSENEAFALGDAGEEYTAPCAENDALVTADLLFAAQQMESIFAAQLQTEAAKSDDAARELLEDAAHNAAAREAVLVRIAQ